MKDWHSQKQGEVSTKETEIHRIGRKLRNDLAHLSRVTDEEMVVQIKKNQSVE